MRTHVRVDLTTKTSSFDP